MKNISIKTSLLFALTITSVISFAHKGETAEKTTTATTTATTLKLKAASCTPSTENTFLEYNNVRAIIETSGYAWQNRASGLGSYEVPKDGGRIVIYAGSLWMGGQTEGLVLKTAAHLYHQDDDFWAGPLSVDETQPKLDEFTQGYGDAAITPEICDEWDQFWETTREEAALHRAYYACKLDNANCDLKKNFPDGYVMPAVFEDWPAHGIDKYHDFFIAPFKDSKDPSGSARYEPEKGDYPGYDLDKTESCPKPRGGKVDLFGDYNLWYVFNDKGNIHTETGGNAIGMEIKAQAFAFATSDEINSMTFYNYEMINRATVTLKDTYFGQYVDADIGCSGDDFAGCDVQRGFGYVYGGTAVDGVECFGSIPWNDGISPAIGVDFFEGPYQDNDGIDNPLSTNIAKVIAEKGIPYEGLGLGYSDGTPDNERMGMSRFVYFSRADGTQPDYAIDPSTAIEFYNYMRGVWIDGTDFVFGGTGHLTSSGATNIKANYIFPGDSDPLNWGTKGEDPNNTEDWTEQTAGNGFGDRRFLQAAGPFTLEPGALNNITVGVVFARATGGDPFASVELVRLADDKAQKLFDNCFRLIDGPDAPDLTISELDKKLVLTISNCSTSNNAEEDYIEKDPNINIDNYRIYLDTVPVAATTDGLPTPWFDVTGTGADIQGSGICETCYYQDSSHYKFQGYQIFQLSDESVGPEDIEDVSKARLVAQCDIVDGVERLINFDFDEDLKAAIPVEKVDGSNAGISHTFLMDEDAFAQGDVALVNYKKYHYMAVSYAHNGYREYNNTDPLFLDGQQTPYLRGRKSCVGGIQSFTGIPHKAPAGVIVNSTYGDTPLITREEGKGNGGLEVEITTESEDEILSKNVVKNLKFKRGGSPVGIKVVDPLKIPNDDFELRFNPSTLVTDVATGKEILYSNWDLTRISTGETESSDTTLNFRNEQLILDWGLSVTIDQKWYIDEQGLVNDEVPSEFLSAEKVYEDSTKQWLSGVSDNDGNVDLNWIRSGTLYDEDQAAIACNNNDRIGVDDNESYEQALSGTFAPFALVSAGDCGIEPVSEANKDYRDKSRLEISSVDIVLTSDESRWTRCPVIEMQNDSKLAFGEADKMKLRESPSVNKNGTDDGSGTKGMGWFPGYAIDLNTGERLNMAFSEDSWLGGHNGRDMIWNPTSTLYEGAGVQIMGGKHYIYVFKSERSEGVNKMPVYDEGKYLSENINSNSITKLTNVWTSCMWVGMPLLNQGQELLSSDLRIKLRVSNQYRKYSHDVGNGQDDGDVSGSLNDWYPLYSFNTGDIAANYSDSAALAALDSINIVPNPYYAYSEYEESRLENRVKIINLPITCTIKIFNSGGQLIKTFTKDNEVTFIDWDLTNHANVPISSGMYIIHINAVNEEGVLIGERVLKWMGVMRVPDLENS